MNIEIGNKLEMKKQHPCGGTVFTVLKTGMDLRLKCDRCGREVLIIRGKAEKNVKRVITDADR